MKHKGFEKYLVALVFGVCSVVSDTTFADEPGSARFQVEVLPSLSVSVSNVSIEVWNGVSTGTATNSLLVTVVQNFVPQPPVECNPAATTIADAVCM